MTRARNADSTPSMVSASRPEPSPSTVFSFVSMAAASSVTAIAALAEPSKEAEPVASPLRLSVRAVASLVAVLVGLAYLATLLPGLAA